MYWLLFIIAYLLLGVFYEKVIFKSKGLKWTVIAITTWPLFLMAEISFFIYFVIWKIRMSKKKSLNDTNKH